MSVTPPQPVSAKQDHEYSVRLLVIAWCLWLIGSWVINLDLRSPVPAGRWLIYSGLLGMMVIWPAWRLSRGDARLDGEDSVDTRGSSPGFGWIIMEWMNLNLVFQAVLWPLRLTTEWGLYQTGCLSGAMAGWSLLTAAFVGWGCRSGDGYRRSLAMGMCLALLLGEPVLLGLFNQSVVWPMYVSPIDTIWGLTVTSGDWIYTPWLWRIGWISGAGVGAWGMLLLFGSDRVSGSG